MVVRVLGRVEVVGSGGVVELSPQLRRLVGLLVVDHGRVVSADRLAEYVADGRVEGSTVRTAVSRLRKVLGDGVENAAGGYRLTEGVEVDATVFIAEVDRARTQPAGDRVDTLVAALESFRGRPLGELADEEWAQVWVSGLEAARTSAVEDLGAALVEVGRAAEAVEVLEPHVLAHPFRERPVGLLMRALAQSGRTPEGLRVFERFRISMRDELGLDPSPELRAVEAELLAGGEEPTVTATGSAPVLPTGTVTFVFTDIEGSTQRWADDEAAMTAALADHDTTLRDVIGEHDGIVFKHTGDGMCAVFTSAPSAVTAAIAAQQQLQLPVRIGIHTGEAELRDGDYFGPTLNRVARIMDAGHGGQILMSASTAALARHDDTIDHGQHLLKGLSTPERIHQVGSSAFPTLRVAASRRGNLPALPSSFVGREVDLAKVVDAALDHRIVTLIGVGGTGKTRLAHEAALRLGATFPDGCWMVQLAPVVIPEAVPFSFLAGTGIPAPTSGEPIDHLVRQLRPQRSLLIVDNCEHLLDTAADVIERIVEECPTVHVLATSREPLMLDGERLLPIPSLVDDDAERLFAERALAEAPCCLDDETQRAAVVAICQRLDGLPLAIELAASRVRAFTPVELLGMLDQRFSVLVGGRRSRMERHQTMRGTLDWSYDLCSELERTVFDRLAVFPARFSMDRAQKVASGDGVEPADVLEVLPALVDRSLVQQSAGFDGTTRYGLLETMRAYGRDHLVEQGSLDSVRDRHARELVESLPGGYPRIYGDYEESDARRRSELLPDAVLALDWLIETESWEDAITVCMIGAFCNEVELWAMVHRLHLAMVERDADEALILAMRSADVHHHAGMSLQESHANAVAYLRSGEQFAFQLAGFDFEYTSSSEFLELLDAIEQRTFEPFATQLVRKYFAIRHAVQAGVDAPADVWAEFERQATETDSRSARRMLSELRAQRAVRDGRWHDAAVHFERALPEPDTILGLGWSHVIARVGLADARAFAGDPVPLSHLVDTWDIVDRHQVTVLRERSCVATAVTARSFGHDELAQRFARWVYQHDPGGLWDLFAPTLDQAGIDAVDLDAPPDDLGELLALLRRAADAQSSRRTDDPPTGS